MIAILLLVIKWLTLALVAVLCLSGITAALVIRSGTPWDVDEIDWLAAHSADEHRNDFLQAKPGAEQEVLNAPPA